MNWLDAVILIVWVLTGLWGASAGGVGMVIPLVVVIAGLALSSRVAEDVGRIFAGVTDTEAAQTIGGFLLIFLGLFVIGAVVNFMISSLLKGLPAFVMVNRVLGVAAGIIVGFVLLSGVLTGVQEYTDRIDESMEESPLAEFLVDNFDVVLRGVKLVPADWDEHF